MSLFRFLPATLVPALVTLAFAGATRAAPVEWKVEDGGNGHYYELVRPGTNPGPSWTAARDAAAAMSFGGAAGHLATVTSAAEHQFINEQFPPFTVIAWIGGVQDPDPTPGTGADQGWSWITGEPWAYAAWLNGEPNDWNGSDERYLSMWVGLGGSLDTWNDNSDLGTPTGYVVEFPIVPEPTSAALLLTLGGLALLRRTPGTPR
jgi:hypothetical protein